MRLKKFKVENFKAISDGEFELSPATVLVGPNNSGKSSILQAIHFAARIMNQASEPNKPSTMSLAEVEYIPSIAYQELAHDGVWGNRSGTSESKFTFEFVDDDGTDHAANVVVKSARNEGLSLTPAIPNVLQPLFRGKDKIFSAYIPGIAGIPLEEPRLTKRHVYKKAASGDSNVVLRNILLLIQNAGKMPILKETLHGVYPDVDFNVTFDEDNDLVIRSGIRFDFVSPWKPLEFAGTGFLQVLQMFAYQSLFEPTIILIDEPESHLHPTFQTRLVRALKDNAQRNGAVVLISTHSPFIVRGLPLNSRTVWLRDGYVKRSTLGEEIKQALGWGALDKSVLLCTEDKNVRMIEGLLGQTPSIFDKVSVVPFEGVSKLGTARLVTDLKRSLGDQHAVLVHRDRDCFSDEELTKWREEFINQGHSVWITQDTEVENYFCSKQYLEAIFDCDHNVASEIFDEAFSNNEPELKEKFTNKRKEINKAIYEKVGGSPKIEELWETLPKIHTISGKIFCSKLRAVAKKYGYDEKLIGRTPDNFSIAPDLISALIRILQQSEAITPTRHPKINL